MDTRPPDYIFLDYSVHDNVDNSFINNLTPNTNNGGKITKSRKKREAKEKKISA